MKTLAFAKLAFVIATSCALACVSSFAQNLKSMSLNFTNGSEPEAGLLQGTDGNFYGTTSAGGSHNGGTIFRVTPAGKLTTIYNFCSQKNCADGQSPTEPLVLATDGNFYGTTWFGGVGHNIGGTIFRITPAGKLTTLYRFCSVGQTCSDGADPNGLVQGPDGNFYGTTNYNGSSNFGGTVFKFSTTGVLTTLHTFCPTEPCSDGLNPRAPLVLGIDGSFYGTTSAGSENEGTVFKITPAGTFTVLHSFCTSGCGDGANPYGALTLATDGNFYGTTFFGGANCESSFGCGTVFRITPAGQLTTLYSFCPIDCSDGNFPAAGVIQASDGNLYGTANGFDFEPFASGPNNDVEQCRQAGYPGACGTVFKLTLDGVFTTIHVFCTTDCSDGADPTAMLLQATNGMFYGSTNWEGKITNSQCANTFQGGCGTLFAFSEGLAPFVQPSPNFGKAGRVIRILGNALTGTTKVTFNGVPATFAVISATYVKAVVPKGATTGTIEVTTPNGTLKSNPLFYVP